MLSEHGPACRGRSVDARVALMHVLRAEYATDPVQARAVLRRVSEGTAQERFRRQIT